MRFSNAAALALVSIMLAACASEAPPEPEVTLQAQPVHRPEGPTAAEPVQLQLRHIDTGEVIPVPLELQRFITERFEGPYQTDQYETYQFGSDDALTLVVAYKSQPVPGSWQAVQCEQMEVALYERPVMRYVGDTPADCRRKSEEASLAAANEARLEQAGLDEEQRQQEIQDAELAAERADKQSKIDALWFDIVGPANPNFSTDAGRIVRIQICQGISLTFDSTSFDALGMRPLFETGQDFEMLTVFGSHFYDGGHSRKVSLHCVFDANGRLHSLRTLDGEKRNAHLANESHEQRFELPIYQQYGYPLPPRA